jgi:hypothetical protein
MKPLIAPGVLDSEEAMLDHDEKDVLNHPNNIRSS